MAAQIKVRHVLRSNTAAGWGANDRVLGRGEPGFLLDAAGAAISWRIGDGASKWSELPDHALGAGGGGGPGADYFEHTQGSASALWTVNHNLGREPSVSVKTVGGVEIVPSVTHQSVNQTQIAFSAATAGRAYFV